MGEKLGRCLFCRASLAYQEQATITGELELVPAPARNCPTAPGRLCKVETHGDRMIADLAKRNSRRRRFGR
jgi:hypothetical protein